MSGKWRHFVVFLLIIFIAFTVLFDVSYQKTIQTAIDALDLSKEQIEDHMKLDELISYPDISLYTVPISVATSELIDLARFHPAEESTYNLRSNYDHLIARAEEGSLEAAALRDSIEQAQIHLSNCDGLFFATVVQHFVDRPNCEICQAIEMLTQGY